MIFRLAAELSTTSTRPPHRSINSASSVAVHRSRIARSCASTSILRRKACGVCACHNPSRAIVAAIVRPSTRLSVSATATAANAPSARRVASIQAANRAGVRERTRRVVHHHDFALGAGECQRDSHRILALGAACYQLDRDFQSRAHDLSAGRPLHPGRHRHHHLIDLLERGDGAQRIVKQRPSSERHEGFRRVCLKPRPASGGDDNDGASHRFRDRGGSIE